MSVSGESSSAKEKIKPFQADGLRRVGLAFFHSLEGIGAALKHEAAFRQECVAACVLIPAALLLEIPVVEKVLLIGVVFLVLITELLNSAIECCVDYISTDLHPFAKRAKDIGSGAVFLSLFFAVGSWALILGANWPLNLIPF
ncbi:diacylglycerol kinase [Puniceicoccus vermicola]|uniref:Diacylglycerol kinase n=1 Tax=Puniceicoccus vermicola TaxID=388746 RepID=A0A7X1B2Y9_9BACT|nr:diacylglycerol kinase [Puniceicoccus vermicola]MBC2603583.1 diacylglycerol kinase [Puniceicoccus vermicola]